MKKAYKPIIIILSVILIVLVGIIMYSLVKENVTDNNKNIENSYKQNTNNELNETIDLNNDVNNQTNTNSNNIVNNVTDNGDSNSLNIGSLFQNYNTQAEQILESMTLEEKVGQMFLARYPESKVISEIKSENPGGYILFGRDFKNKMKSSIKKELEQCQDSSKIKLILGVDEEGGTVVRVSAYTEFRSSKFKSPQQLWKIGQLPAILKDSTEKSDLLKSIGLNMNLAPVVDIPRSESDFIYARSYGRGAKNTAIYTSELIKTMNSDGMISTMKHFPGYGNNVDTHTGIAVDKRSYSTFEQIDFLPFKSGIEANAPTILVNHNIVQCMDKDKPASLSENVHRILREELNFSGIIITDDLAMDAVKKYVDNGEAAVQAVMAGNDMIISSNFKEQKKEIENAVKHGKIPEEKIDLAVKRILAWKYAYNII